MRPGPLVLMGLLAMGASPTSSFVTATPMPSFAPTPHAPPITAPPGYTTAPTPNEDSLAPQAKASKDASVGPGFFTRRDQYRGEGLSPSSSVQAEQDRKAKPGAGINLRMPLQ